MPVKNCVQIMGVKMNHLASRGNSLKLNHFDFSSFFYTESPLFNELTLSEKKLSALDLFFSIILIFLFSPIMLMVAFAIKISMGGSVFYSQIRVGKNGKEFRIYKFRSMIENAEEKTGATLSSLNDNRVTKLGKFLRASHLDELPQLFNVFLGDMSFVGPRPERPEFVSIFENEILEYNKRSRVKPGITGLAQICLPYDAKAHEKLEFDLYYIENKESLLFNALIAYYTALKMVSFYKNQ